jgi:HSP20 family protein
VAETESELVVRVGILGVDPEDIDLSLTRGTLFINGEKKLETEEKEGNYHLAERSYGSFARSIRLPVKIESERISASYKNGVLTVVLPKFEGDQKKGIKIKVE